MILTEKTKRDFLEYYNNHSIKYLLSWTDFDDLPLVVKNSLIIEWFDSVGIYICTSYFKVGKGYFEYRLHYTGVVGQKETRQEATEEAIKKANEIYNKK